jgi:hypothetical protein
MLRAPGQDSEWKPPAATKIPKPGDLSTFETFRRTESVVIAELTEDDEESGLKREIQEMLERLVRVSVLLCLCIIVVY